MSSSRTDRVAVITGAAGGLGSAIANRLAADGYRLALTDAVSCVDVAAQSEQCGAEVFHACCDLDCFDQITAFSHAVLARYGRADILINNAARMGMQPIDELDIDAFRGYLRTNIEAPFAMSKAFIPAMTAHGFGRIVNTVSNSVWAPFPGVTGYVTSKMGLIGLTRTLAVELGERGITVNAVSPNLTRHRNTEQVMPDAAFDSQAQRQAIKRTATPADIVGAVAFLISDEAAFMTGQTLSVDGGQILL
jgi:NAD(P)-dependent dehydrogenase (short-subunit alcohol dehydrogenase family)